MDGAMAKDKKNEAGFNFSEPGPYMYHKYSLTASHWDKTVKAVNINRKNSTGNVVSWQYFESRGVMWGSFPSKYCCVTTFPPLPTAHKVQWPEKRRLSFVDPHPPLIKETWKTLKSLVA